MLAVEQLSVEHLYSGASSNTYLKLERIYGEIEGRSSRRKREDVLSASAAFLLESAPGHDDRCRWWLKVEMRLWLMGGR